MCWSPAHVINWMLIALVSLSVLVSCSPVPQYLICSGEYSQLSYDDCQGRYHSITSACYFLEGFGHYRPCADVCNDVLYPSREEGKCKFRCKDYAHNYCHVGQLGTDTTTATTAVSTSPIPYTTTKTYIPSRRGDEKKNKKMTTQQQTILGLAIGLPLFFLILLGILVACCWKKVKNWLIVRLTNKKQATDDQQVPEAAVGTPDKSDQKSSCDQDLLLNDDVNTANKANIPDDLEKNTAVTAGGDNGDQRADPDPLLPDGDERSNNQPQQKEGGNKPTQATGTNDPADLNPENSAGAAGGDNDDQGADYGEEQRNQDNGDQRTVPDLPELHAGDEQRNIQPPRGSNPSQLDELPTSAAVRRKRYENSPTSSGYDSPASGSADSGTPVSGLGTPRNAAQPRGFSQHELDEIKVKLEVETTAHKADGTYKVNLDEAKRKLGGLTSS